MEHIPQDRERNDAAPPQEDRDADDRAVEAEVAAEAGADDTAREVAEEATGEDEVAVEDDASEDPDQLPDPGMSGEPEEHTIVESIQAQEAMVTDFEDATERQREAVMGEMAEQDAQGEGADAAPAAEEAALETVGEPDQPVAEDPVHASPPTEPPAEAEKTEVEEELAVDEPQAEPSAAVDAAGPAVAGDAAAAEVDAGRRVAAEPEPEPEPTSDPFTGPGDWYVIHTYAGYENKVKANLESRIQTMQMQDKIFDVHIPMEDVMEIKGGRKQVVQKKVFPGYLLVKMEYDDDSWYVVRNTPGVTGFVASGTGQKPTPLPRHEVEKFLAPQKEEAKPQFRLEFEEGDVVRIIAGPFADFNGTISEINVDQSKVKVMVNIFDRETPVELSFDQVARV